MRTSIGTLLFLLTSLVLLSACPDVDSGVLAPTPTAAASSPYGVGLLSFELDWALEGEDFDLHIVRGDGCRRTVDDCHWENCKDCPGNTSCPDWGQAGKVGNPSLETDDVVGTGPERVDVFEPWDARYWVLVHDFSGPEQYLSNSATVMVYFDGELAGKFETDAHDETVDFGDEEEDWWTAGYVDLEELVVVPVGTRCYLSTCMECAPF